jgi:DNA-directed RNA polymerase subunit RPC12/RpoP
MARKKKVQEAPAEQEPKVMTPLEVHRAQPPLSERRVIKDSFKKNTDDSVKFNMGFMPGNSYRCKDCRAGFTLIQGTDEEVKCLECGSANVVPHADDPVRG